MAFKDSLSKIAKSIGDGAKSAAQKSGEMMEITKLNMSISSEESKIKGVYTKIGEVLYKKFASGEQVDKDLFELCTSISIIEGNIDVMKERIEELKTHKPSEDKHVQENESNIGEVENRIGETVNIPDTNNQTFRAENESDIQFYEEPPVGVYNCESPVDVPNKCPNCGETFSDKIKFCPACGAKLKQF